ncbi:MAG: YbjN domain-containing protein [Rhodospirillaceae bacterium]
MSRLCITLLMAAIIPLMAHAEQTADLTLKANPEATTTEPTNPSPQGTEAQGIKSTTANNEGVDNNKKHEELVHKYTTQDILKILQAQGYGSPTISDNKAAIRFKADGHNITIIIFNDGDLQLFYGLDGKKASLSDINNWNATKRLSRAYLDKDGDAVLESDFMMDAGATESQITNFIRMFQVSVSSYRKFLFETVK